MEEVIRQAIEEFGINKVEIGNRQKIFTNLDGTLKDGKGNVLSKTEEAKIRAWHNIDKNEPIYILFYSTTLKRGDFFTADREYYFSACIRGEGISFAGIIQTDGWDKEKDGMLAITWQEIEAITFVKSLDIETENNVSNAYFIANDPVFTAFNKPHCVVFHSAGDNSYINVPAIYFAYDIALYNDVSIINLLSKILSEYQILSAKNDEYFRALGEELKKLKDDGEYQKLLNRIEEVKEEVFFWVYYYYKIISLLQLDYTFEAYRLFDEFKVLFDKTNEKEENYNAFLGFYTLTEAEIYKKKGELYNAAYRYDKLKHLEEKSDIPDSSAISYFEKYKKDAYNSFLSKFAEIDYNDRKVITISRTEKLFKSDHITLLQMNNLPAVNFPITHPKQDHTYVCHPYKTDTYLPIEEYDYELLTDRINEYCYLLQCLGATSISIENTKGESSDANAHNSSQINAEANIKLYSGKIDETKSQRTRDYVKNMLKIGREQQFNPIKQPFVPDNLIWFPHEIGWQRLVRQRLEGNMLKHSEYMSSTDHKILSNSEMSDINGELKILLASLKGGQKQEKETNIESNQEIEWRINVEFKPIEAFGNNNYSANILAPQQIAEHTEAPTEKERQYMEEVRFMLEDDSIIDGQERKMLDEMQKTLNISAERAPLLEQEVINAMLSFTPNEQKYIEEIKFMLEDDGQIDEQERKMLDGMLKVLNISPERAQQLEIIVLNKGDLTKEEKEYIEKFKAFVTTDGVVSDRERRILNRLANLLGITEKRAIELEKQTTVD